MDAFDFIDDIGEEPRQFDHIQVRTATSRCLLRLRQPARWTLHAEVDKGPGSPPRRNLSIDMR